MIVSASSEGPFLHLPRERNKILLHGHSGETPFFAVMKGEHDTVAWSVLSDITVCRSCEG